MENNTSKNYLTNQDPDNSEQNTELPSIKYYYLKNDSSPGLLVSIILPNL